jgi:hypothetical protein
MIINENGARHAVVGDSLNVLARQAIRSGRLPMRDPDRMWGGDCGGESCAICAAPIEGTAAGFELEFRRDNGVADCCHLHLPCYAAWVAEFPKMSAGQP